MSKLPRLAARSHHANAAYLSEMTTGLRALGVANGSPARGELDEPEAARAPLPAPPPSYELGPPVAPPGP